MTAAKLKKAQVRRRPGKKGGGSVLRTPKSKYWWIAYVSGGKRRYESSKSELVTVARTLLASRLADTDKGLVVTPKIGKITVCEGLQTVIDDMKMNERRRTAHTQRRIDKHLLRTIEKGGTVTGYFNPDR